MNRAVKKALMKCASFDHGDCIFNNPCRILAGDRCPYLEAAVLPASQVAQQAYQRGHNMQVTQMRLCSCGQVLQPRRRMCDECRAKADKEAKKRYYHGKNGSRLES